MSTLSRWLINTLAFWHQSQDQHLDWQLARQPQLTELRQAQALAQQAQAAKLRKLAQQLAHELAVSKVQNSNELAMVKIQCKQELKDYQDYLGSLEKLKESMRSSYLNLPEAVVFTIHHHAKQLLNHMWEAKKPDEKIKYEMQLVQFMTAVHEDNQASLEGNNVKGIPTRALAFIEADRQEKT